MLTNYLITYIGYDDNGNPIKDGVVRIKNVRTEDEAIVSFFRNIKHRYPDIRSIRVLHSKEESSILDRLPDGWNDIFGGFFKK